MREISIFVERVLECCPTIRSVWVIGARANGNASSDWDLVAFADAATLQRLRKAAILHRADVHFHVVTDGDRFEIAWGRMLSFDSLLQCGWRQSTDSEAYYNEAKWSGRSHQGQVKRTRRKAIRVWQSSAAP
jgi:predicted nucleotidyltransferase